MLRTLKDPLSVLMLVLGVVAIVCIYLSIGCTIQLPGDSTVINTATNNATDFTPPAASPSPDVTGCPAPQVVASIRVNPFGYDCPDGIPAPPNNSGLLPVGCTAAVTATPKDLRGNDVPAELHGPGIVWTVVAGSQFIEVTDDPNEAFNKNVLGLSAPGEFVLQATVCGKSGAWVGRTTSDVVTLHDFEVK